MSWVKSNMSDDTRRTINVFLGSRSKTHDPNPMRGLLGIASLIIGGVLIYTSLPYASAFVNVGKIVGLSKIDRQVTLFRADVTNTAPVKKVYLRQGQGLRVHYDMPVGAELDLTVMRCQSRPVIESWSCSNPMKQVIEITESTSGIREISAPEPGFYYFTDSVTLSGAPESDYTLIWKRT